MSYDLTGKVKLVRETQTFAGGFTKREVVVIDESGNYPQEINVEFVQDKVTLLDNVRAGDEVTIAFDLRGREHNGRWFNSIHGWKITSHSQSEEPNNPAPASDDDEQDIPF
jgi:hypothetical protein